MQDNFIKNEDLTAQLVRDLIKEKRSDRFWKNIRFFLIFIFVLIIFFIIFGQTSTTISKNGESKDYVALIRLNGMIGPGEDFSAETVIPLLKTAFTDTDAKGVILDINSGGGTPVQAGIIHDAILELKKKYNKKVVVVGEDMLASGAYFVAVAADKIYVNPNSLTGSIGVIMKGFGFPELIKKVGIERRVFTSGVDKDRLDPFLAENPADIAKIQQVLAEVHENFSQVVMSGRAGKLHGNPADIFTGDFWSGTGALKLGLVDKLGNLSDAMRDEFQVSRYKDYTSSGSLLKSLAGQLGSSLNLALTNNEVKVLTKI
ncbi:MAG: S49 family peptidase [Gammaproteobacteria bacterium]|nr:S49 family peptidase [Gammaproteobacteria bacterium]